MGTHAYYSVGTTLSPLRKYLSAFLYNKNIAQISITYSLPSYNNINLINLIYVEHMHINYKLCNT